jgi:hypothetical protein
MAVVPAAAVPVPDDIGNFLATYRDAFNALNGVAVAQLYAVPSGIASDTGYTHWPSMEPIERNMLALCQLYRDNGFAATHYTVERYMPQGAQYAVIDLMQTPQGWRVLLCTAYSEKPLNR